MQIPVYIDAVDPATAATVRAPLLNVSDIAETSMLDDVSETVFVVAAQDGISDAAARVAALHSAGCRRIVLVTGQAPADHHLLRELGENTTWIVGAQDLSEQLVTTIRDAGRSVDGPLHEPPRSVAGSRGALNGTSLGHLRALPGPEADHEPGSQLDSQSDSQPSPPPGLDLSDRERAVLRLAADGYDTKEIARMLSFSQRTIKGVLREVTTRYGLRNRCHAVAYAIRHGAI